MIFHTIKYKRLPGGAWDAEVTPTHRPEGGSTYKVTVEKRGKRWVAPVPAGNEPEFKTRAEAVRDFIERQHWDPAYEAMLEELQNSPYWLTHNPAMTQGQAREVYDVLVEEAGADSREHTKESFARQQAEDHLAEYRFCGLLGFGGKFWRYNGLWYVNCYRENLDGEAKDIITRTNQRLMELRERA